MKKLLLFSLLLSVIVAVMKIKKRQIPQQNQSNPLTKNGGKKPSFIKFTREVSKTLMVMV